MQPFSLTKKIGTFAKCITFVNVFGSKSNKMIALEEDALIQKIKNGDENAFKHFYESNVPSLRYFGSKYLDVPNLVDDIVQDALVSFWNQRAYFDSHKAAKSYLYKIVKNSCLNSIRHAKVIKKHYDAVMNEDYSESFLDNVLEAEIFDLILSFFNELPPACKQVYKLSLSGLSHNEISAKLNISVNTVKKHKSNANLFIRNKLDKILSILLFI